MDNDTYERMVLMGSGKIARNQKWLDDLAIEGHKKEEVEAKAKYEKEHPSPRSHRELELEQRSFDLKMFGRSAMERNAKPLDEGLGELSVPSVDSPVVRLQEHSSSPAPHKDANGRLLLQNHAGCGIRQKLELRRG